MIYSKSLYLSRVKLYAMSVIITIYSDTPRKIHPHQFRAALAYLVGLLVGIYVMLSTAHVVAVSVILASLCLDN
jgi:hypothetical protein